MEGRCTSCTAHTAKRMNIFRMLAAPAPRLPAAGQLSHARLHNTQGSHSFWVLLLLRKQRHLQQACYMSSMSEAQLRDVSAVQTMGQAPWGRQCMPVVGHFRVNSNAPTLLLTLIVIHIVKEEALEGAS